MKNENNFFLRKSYNRANASAQDFGDFNFQRERESTFVFLHSSAEKKREKMFNEVTILDKATWRCFRSAYMSHYWSAMWHDRRTGSSMHFSCSFIGIITVRRVPKTTKILFNKFARMKFIAWKGEDKKEALVRLPWAKSIIIQNNAPMLIKLDNDTTNTGEKGRAANSSRCVQRSPPPWR